jgi:SAM-dependent methyltransferase
MSLRTMLAGNRVARALFQNLFVTGDNVRLATQLPVLRSLLPARAERALDAGAGSGEYTRRLLLPRASQVVAMDLDAASMRRLVSRLRPDERKRCSPALGSVAEVPYRKASFDLVLLCEVLEHCEDDDAVLDEIARVLKPGGTLVIAVPVPPAPYPDQAHVREGYTFDDLAALLAQHDFELRDHRYCMFRWSRAVLRWRMTSRLPLPLMFLPHLEHRLFGGAGLEALPFDVVVRATRKPSA